VKEVAIKSKRLMSAKAYRVGRSRTGLGLFATEQIPKGARIVEYTGPRIRAAKAEAQERAHRGRYLFEIDEHWMIDGSPRSNIARYANHACRPNAEAVGEGRRIYLCAKKTIRPGEEITYNYGREYFDIFLADGRCRCAACVS
jgi:SET domain-containing protein